MPVTATKTTPIIDVLVLCALQDEYKAMLQVTNSIISPGWEESKNTDGWLIAQANFVAADGKPIRVLASFASNMGREHASALAHKLLQAHPARCLAMTGICGGWREKVTLGDVIFADRLYSYDAGKLINDGVDPKFFGDQLQYHPSAAWVQRMQSTISENQADWVKLRPKLTLEYQEDWVLLRRLADEDPTKHPKFDEHCPDWPRVLERLRKREWLNTPMTLTASGKARAEDLALTYVRGLPKPPEFQIHVAPIATGAAVVEDPQLFPRLAQSVRKILGIDMEASALGVVGEFADLPVVVVKAVSDYGDGFKDDRYRDFAARAAAECLIALMKRANDLLPQQQDATLQMPSETGIPNDLIQLLADTYPDPPSARAVWQRVGGKASDVEHITRPADLWQTLWLRSINGAAVRPADLLRAVLETLPNNKVIEQYLAVWQAK